MKHLLSATVAMFLASALAAQAADLPPQLAPMPVKAVPVTTYDWSGFYVGGYWGTAITQSRATTGTTPGTVELNDDGLTGGLTVGYNWQIAPNWLIGAEADFGLLRTDRSFTEFNDVPLVGVKTDWLATLRGRVGYVTGPSLIYVTGGAAALHGTETFGTNPGLSINRFTNWGWTAGGGIESKLSRNWSSKTEYLYVDAGTGDGFPVNFGPENASFHHQVHVLKTGLNYKLDGGPFDGLPFFRAPLSSPLRWAGLYAGVNAGGGLSRVHLPNSFYGVPQNELDVNGAGFTGGAQLGYNFLVFSNWLAGVEGDFNYLGINHSYTDWNNTAGGLLVQPSLRTSWYGTLRGRIGSSTGPAFMYITGGAAFVNVENSIVAFGVPASTRTTRSGWTLGGGIETELDARWSVRLEYLYIDVGTERVTSANGFSDFDNRFQIVRAGLNYKFGDLFAMR